MSPIENFIESLAFVLTEDALKDDHCKAEIQIVQKIFEAAINGKYMVCIGPLSPEQILKLKESGYIVEEDFLPDTYIIYWK
jgi:hypothetical protein